MNAHTIPVRAFVETDDEREERLREEAFEALREECLEEFETWRAGDWRNREFADFSNWIVSKARWNRPNKYLDALVWHERALLGLDGRRAECEADAKARAA